MARQRRIRDEAPLPDDATFVRALFDAYTGGAAFDRAVLIADASGGLRRTRTAADRDRRYETGRAARAVPAIVGAVLGASAVMVSLLILIATEVSP